MPPDNDDFQIKLPFTGREKHYGRPIGIAVAIVAIIFILATMTTDVAARLVPMNDEYLQALIPVAADGSEPLSLKSLNQEIVDKTINVRGTVANRTDYAISNVIAAIEMLDTTGRFPQTVEVPIQPAVLESQGTGEFTASATLQEKPAGYFIKFRLADGPFIPHKDDRALSISVPAQ